MEDLVYRTESVFKAKHGVREPMPELTITHIISYSQLRSQPFTPTTKGKGWSGEDLSIQVQIMGRKGGES